MYKSKYGNLIQHLMNEHDLILLDSEQQEIENWVDKDLKAINYTRCCEELKAFKDEFIEAWEDGSGGDSDLYRKAKNL